LWFIAGQGADDGPLPFLSLHLSGAVFQSVFTWTVFPELRRLLRPTGTSQPQLTGVPARECRVRQRYTVYPIRELRHQ